MNDPFFAIRHYTEEEAALAIRRIFENEVFVNALRFFEPNIDVDKIVNEVPKCKSIYDFQQMVAKDFVEFLIQHSTSGIDLKGLENLEKGKNYLFIANHRDIVFDTSILQYYFLINHYPTSKIAIGDNLLSSDLLVDIGKINKMIVIKRTVSVREKLENYRLLSNYISHGILEENDSVWIAQRNGRTKDGIDKTQHGLVKMFSMYDPKNTLEALRRLNITPVTISYEYEACDQLKARELALSENQVYVKKPGEDFESIKQGLFGQKGRVSLVIGKTLNEKLDSIDKTLSPKEIISLVAEMIDNQVAQDYKLYPNNYIAYDILEQSDGFCNFYSAEEKEIFLEYLNKQSILSDVSEEKMTYYLLNIYANPVKTIIKDIPE